MNDMILRTMTKVLADVPTAPDYSPDAPGQLKGLVGTALGLVAWAGTAAGVAGVLITGTMMAVSMKRGESSEHLSRLGMVLGGCILIAVAGPLVNFAFGGGGGDTGN